MKYMVRCTCFYFHLKKPLDQPDRCVVDYLKRDSIVTHIIVEAKLKKRQTNVVAQVKSSFVFIYLLENFSL